ncbi:Peptidase S41A, C-terminal protease [Candidatus Glomeribacter gigasporarum BEG34]|uniref:Peptidase S41A, C-terminal protease n=1 Tax=Candidatus Glomeribacter gigasporarum BEG34 TaxID=1070319 RepID=G2J802_9BURK|nr:S41 family peptidase [Candidatus Glomeribacter gigasporarum]CCD28899.1 Peptidase S41A, C-terminal protease [Candidatus Glomeribacter gigasporarum BEG34]
MLKYFKNTGLIAIGLAAGILAGVQFATQTNAQGPADRAAQKSTQLRQPGPLPLEELRLLAEVFGQVKQSYVQPVDDKQLLTAAVKGMVSSLDPHSSYLDSKEYQELQEQTSGRFAGLGIEISQEDGWVKVIAPIEDTPAFRAGIQPGDLIMRIDDKAVRNMTLNRAVQKMRGKAGTKVRLTIFRKAANRTFSLTLTRAEVHVQSVKTKLIQPAYAWVRITSFQEDTVASLAEKLNEIARRTPHLKGLILDLRSNGGGLLQGAVGVTAAFVPRDALIVSTNGQEPGARKMYRSALADYRLPSLSADPLRNLSPVFKTVPLVVLTNAYSASASEIVAGALQDHQRAQIMGKTTFGKGSVQTVRPLTADTGLRLTVAYYYTPSGRSIQNKGIHPDLPVDQYPDGDPDEVYITREADYSNHLANTQEPGEEKEAREQRRLEQIRLLEEQNAKKTPEQREKDRQRTPPLFGSEDDFMVQQALHYLKGEPVQTSKSLLERASATARSGQSAPRSEPFTSE